MHKLKEPNEGINERIYIYVNKNYNEYKNLIKINLLKFNILQTYASFADQAQELQI